MVFWRSTRQTGGQLLRMTGAHAAMLVRMRTIVVSFFCSMTFAAAEASDPSWWHLCAGCQTANDFRVEAVRAASDASVVFVSNPESGETRSFDRSTTWEETEDGVIRTTRVSDREVIPHQQRVFREALGNARIGFTTIDARRVNAFAGIPEPSSAIGAIRGGLLANSFFFGLHIEIRDRGLIPTPASVGADAGLELHGLSDTLGLRDSLRIEPIALRVRYPDGSHINAVYTPDGRWAHVSVVDQEGNDFDIDTSSNNRPVIAASVIGDYVFVGEELHDAVVDFVQSIHRSARPWPDCTWREEPEGWMMVRCPPD